MGTWVFAWYVSIFVKYFIHKLWGFVYDTSWDFLGQMFFIRDLSLGFILNQNWKTISIIQCGISSIKYGLYLCHIQNYNWSFNTCEILHPSYVGLKCNYKKILIEWALAFLHMCPYLCAISSINCGNLYIIQDNIFLSNVKFFIHHLWG